MPIAQGNRKLAKQINSVTDALTVVFNKEMAALDPLYQKIATTLPSDGSFETYGWLGAMPGMREWVGERVFKELDAATWTILNRWFESSVLISRDAIADDRVQLYGPALQKLARKAAHHADELLIEALLMGETENGLDGVPFFSANHPGPEGVGTQSNLVTRSYVDDEADSLPTPAEFKKAYYAARRRMFRFTNETGETMTDVHTGRRPMAVVCSVEFEEVAIEAFTAESFGSDSGSNVVIDRPEVYGSQLIETPGAFFVFHVGNVVRPLIFQEREPVTTQVKGQDDIEHKDVKFMTEARHNVGLFGWWDAVKVVMTPEAPA